MKILLLGAGGQVGFELQRTLSALGEVVPATRTGTLPGGIVCLRADLGNPASLAQALDEANSNVIVNAAAYTAVDRAEDEPEFADRINGDALAEIGVWAARRRATVLHYSTDYVFDGRNTRPYREDDATAPLGVYGRSKLAGESALAASGCDHLILRTAWVYGARGANFLRTMLRLGAERERLTVVDDQHGAPTSSRLIAAASALVLQRYLSTEAKTRADHSGIYHLAAAGQTTWCGFARAILSQAGSLGLLARVPEIAAIATRDFPTKAKRPAYSVLDTGKLRERFGVHLPEWTVGLASTLGELADARLAARK